MNIDFCRFSLIIYWTELFPMSLRHHITYLNLIYVKQSFLHQIFFLIQNKGLSDNAIPEGKARDTRLIWQAYHSPGNAWIPSKRLKYCC